MKCCIVGIAVVFRWCWWCKRTRRRGAWRGEAYEKARREASSAWKLYGGDCGRGIVVVMKARCACCLAKKKADLGELFAHSLRLAQLALLSSAVISVDARHCNLRRPVDLTSWLNELLPNRGRSTAGSQCSKAKKPATSLRRVKLPILLLLCSRLRRWLGRSGVVHQFIHRWCQLVPEGWVCNHPCR